MQNTRIPERFSVVAEARAKIERACMHLRVQVRALVPAPSRFVQERRQQYGARAAATRGRANRHPADLDAIRIEHIEASRADRTFALEDQGMDARRLRPVVRVDFFFRRNALFFDEHRRAQRQRFAHTLGVARRK